MDDDAFYRRLLGVGGVLMGGGMTAWGWHTAMECGYYTPKMAFIGSMALVAGIGALVVSDMFDEPPSGEWVQEGERNYTLTAAGKGVMVLAAIAGFANWGLMGLLER